MSAPRNRLTGTFLEICSCDVICGCCWLDSPNFETMTCSGLSVWRLGEASTFNGVDLCGTTVCCASAHRGTKSRPLDAVTLVYIDAASDEQRHALRNAMSAAGSPLGAVAALRSNHLKGYRFTDDISATITVTDLGNDRWQVDVAGITNDNRSTISATAAPSAVRGESGRAHLDLTGAPDGLERALVGFAENLAVTAYAPPEADPDRPDVHDLPLINLSLSSSESRSATVCNFDWYPHHT